MDKHDIFSTSYFSAQCSLTQPFVLITFNLRLESQKMSRYNSYYDDVEYYEHDDSDDDLVNGFNGLSVKTLAPNIFIIWIISFLF